MKPGHFLMPDEQARIDAALGPSSASGEWYTVQSFDAILLDGPHTLNDLARLVSELLRIRDEREPRYFGRD